MVSKTSPAVTAETPDVPAPITPEAALTDARANHQSRIDQMRDYFAKQPKRRVKVRNDGDVSVQVNGYTFLIQANVSVDVPEDVAALLEQADYI